MANGECLYHQRIHICETLNLLNPNFNLGQQHAIDLSNWTDVVCGLVYMTDESTFHSSVERQLDLSNAIGFVYISVFVCTRLLVLRVPCVSNWSSDVDVVVSC